MKVRFGLVSCFVKNDDKEHQLKQVERYASVESI
jgi:hypothetical protein